MGDVKLFCGIDWAEAHHDVAIIDGDGQLVAKKRIADDPAGFAGSCVAGINADLGRKEVARASCRKRLGFKHLYPLACSPQRVLLCP
jgi:Transposase